MSTRVVDRSEFDGTILRWPQQMSYGGVLLRINGGDIRDWKERINPHICVHSAIGYLTVVHCYHCVLVQSGKVDQIWLRSSKRSPFLAPSEQFDNNEVR